MTLKSRWTLIIILVVGTVLAYSLWRRAEGTDLPVGIASGNGRLEAVDIDIAAKTGGRLKDVLPQEGDFVTEGQVVAQMDTSELMAEKAEASAQLRRAEIGIDTARSVVTQRRAEREAAEAGVELQQAVLDAATSRLARSEHLVRSNAISQQTLDDDRASERQARASLASARASVAASEAAIGAAEAQVIDAEAAVEAARASVARVSAQIDDATLTAPRDGRVQYRLAQPGEVLGSGGRVINMVDVSDVYMSFFLPTEQAGRVALGAEVRLVMDTAPDVVIPARVSFVADVAQFTPKTVETEKERLKLTFRVRARIAPELLRHYMEQVKTGLPGMAYVKLDPTTPWPEFLNRNLVQ
ncbi:HlyD family secretion protein [Pseudodonghicola xiamenensis]|uniref:Glycoside hydrolase family 43 n=1 Tax=Pseudodonghicola xiamenensis TaxID=337702 RepID=A0A8J3H781_9RHOB|nr:HlyD family efflux transporter periplasmic adaptor subunit [Pseudodonghicola xiamenensis]GHG86300.1 glycoside hydrolase family 43 [Pseudodonghicola xiamenensis]